MTREGILAEIERLRRYGNESVFCQALINSLEKQLEELDNV